MKKFTIPDFANPTEFDSWWRDTLDSGFAPQQIVDIVQKDIDTPMAHIRCAQIISNIDYELSKKLTLKAYLSSNLIERMFALQRLTWLNLRKSYYSNNQESNNANNFIDLYKNMISEFEKIEIRSNLYVEVLARMLRGYSEALFLTENYSNSNLEITKAILIADALNMKDVFFEFKSFQLSIMFRLGYLKDVNVNGDLLINNKDIPEIWKNRALSTTGFALCESGDSEGSLNLFKNLVKMYPDSDSHKSFYYLTQANFGQLNEKENIEICKKHLTNESFVFLKCDRLLLCNLGNPSRKDLNEINRIILMARP